MANLPLIIGNPTVNGVTIAGGVTTADPVSITTFGAATTSLVLNGTGTSGVALGNSAATTPLLAQSSPVSNVSPVAGNLGQVLTSGGANKSPFWSNPPTGGVITFSGGVTGFNPTVPSTGAVVLSGVLNIANGGTGQNTRQSALNALSGTQTATFYLRSDGTNVSLSGLNPADLSTFVSVSKGGTGMTSPGVAGNVLTSNGSFWVSQSPVAVGANAQIFTTPGTFTFTIPAQVSSIKTTVVGGGGNGSSALGGAGGGGGGVGYKWYTELIASNTLTVTVGGTAGNSGITSGTQTVSSVIANGGDTTSGTTGGAGGSVTGADYFISGGAGGSGANGGAGGAAGGGNGSSDGLRVATGGVGLFGVGASAIAAKGYGSGGSATLLNGTGGIVIIEW